jgi:hypothetical protein
MSCAGFDGEKAVFPAKLVLVAAPYLYGIYPMTRCAIQSKAKLHMFALVDWIDCLWYWI